MLAPRGNNGNQLEISISYDHFSPPPQEQRAGVCLKSSLLQVLDRAGKGWSHCWVFIATNWGDFPILYVSTGSNGKSLQK